MTVFEFIVSIFVVKTLNYWSVQLNTGTVNTDVIKVGCRAKLMQPVSIVAHFQPYNATGDKTSRRPMITSPNIADYVTLLRSQ